MTDSNQKDW